MGISPNGQYVCGYYQCIINTAAFVYDTQTRQFITIPLGPGFYDAIANDVNDAGVVVGTGSRTNIGQRGFVYRLSSGQWTELLPLPEGIWSGANAINASGVVCGFRSIGYIFGEDPA